MRNDNLPVQRHRKSEPLAGTSHIAEDRIGLEKQQMEPVTQPPQELKNALHELIPKLMDYGGTDAYWAAETLCDERPDLVAKYGRDHIAAVAGIMLDNDLPEASERFTALFGEFNSRYFNGRLPKYSVKVGYVADWVRTKDGLEATAGCINIKRKQIRIAVVPTEEYMVSTLLHMMAHAATDGRHGTKFTDEMVRLWSAGAPVLFDDVTMGSAAWRAILRVGIVGPVSAQPGSASKQREPNKHRAVLTPKERGWLEALRLIGPNRDQELIARASSAFDWDQSLKSKRRLPPSALLESARLSRPA